MATRAILVCQQLEQDGFVGPYFVFCWIWSEVGCCKSDCCFFFSFPRTSHARFNTRLYNLHRSVVCKAFRYAVAHSCEHASFTGNKTAGMFASGSVSGRDAVENTSLDVKFENRHHCFVAGVLNTWTACGPRGRFLRPAMLLWEFSNNIYVL